MSSIENLDQEKPINFDEQTLEIYSILEKDYKEVLYVESFEIPQEKLDFYTARHYEIYSQKAKEIHKDLPDSLVLSSGMFGGKTTLSFLLLEHLLEDDRNIELLIADVMGEDYITARSFKGSQRRKAKRFGNLTNYEKILDELGSSHVDTIFLDEFSFLDVNIVEDLLEMCSQEKKNLILTGLNTSYLGQPLPVFAENSKIIENSEVEVCYSFVNGFCDYEPLGTSTIRYVRLNDKWVLDCGLLPLVVSKEKTNVVHYAPAMYEHTTVSILQERQDLLQSILSPSVEKAMNQNLLLKELEK